MIGKLSFRQFVEQEDAWRQHPNDDVLKQFNVQRWKHDPMFSAPLAANISMNKKDAKTPHGVRDLRVVKSGPDFVVVRDETGACDKEGMNQKNPAAPCSPTHGKTWVLRRTGKEWPYVSNPNPAPAAGGAQPGGMPGGPPAPPM